MKTTNKLTLKALKSELELLKKNSSIGSIGRKRLRIPPIFFLFNNNNLNNNNLNNNNLNNITY
jgi:hypothetical protein